MAGKYDKNIKITVDDKGSLKQKTKDIDKLNKAVDNNTKKSGNLDRNMKGNAKMSSNASKNFSKQAQGMQGVLVPAYAEVAARVFALTAAFTALSNVANYNVLIKGQSEYAKMTGKNMSTIARSVQIASKHMLDFKEASTSVALATTSGLGTGQIIKMTKAAVDSSAALGRSMTDTMDRLTRGIVKAEPEILDEIGVIIRLDTVYKNYAQSVSKATAELTEGEKATARYNAIIGQLEGKFGGIASKIDPNYFQALASTVLDMTNSFGTFLVDGLNPILKWLSKSQGVLGVFMALIAKSLVGKMFPIFSTFGKKISNMPKQMGKNIDKLEGKIGKLNGTMIKGSKVTASILKEQAGQILKPTQRGAAFDKNPLGSTGATLRQARASVKDGVVSFGKLEGVSSKVLKGMEQQYTKLNDTVKKGLPLQVKAAANVHKLSKSFLNAKKGMTTFAASHIKTWSAINRAVNQHGLYAGLGMAVRQIGKQWDYAMSRASMYGKVISGLAVATKVAVSGTALIGKALGKAGAAGMAIYATYQIGKLIVGLFWDLDTPFMRATEAVSALNESLEKSLESINEMSATLSMGGFASSAMEATKNAEFSTNLGEELYTATSKAMNKLKADISTRTFWDEFADFFKSIIGSGLKDSLAESIEKGMSAMSKLNFSTKATDDLINKLYKGKSEVTEVVGQKLSTNNLLGAGQYVDIKETRAVTNAEKVATLSTEDRVKVLATLEQGQKRAADSSKIYSTDLKSLATSFDTVAKSAKTYGESLLTGTPVKEMAAAQKEIRKIWDEGSLSGSDTILMAQAAGFTDSKNFFIKELEDTQKAQLASKKVWLADSKNDSKEWAESKIFKISQKDITEAAKDAYDSTLSYLDLLGEDWVQMQKDALNATTDRIKAETQLNLLQKFSPASSIKEQAQYAEAIAKAKWDEASAANNILQKDSTASPEEKAQSTAKLLQLKIAVNMAGARELDIQRAYAAREGKTLTLTARYAAKLKDLNKSIKGLSEAGISDQLNSFNEEKLNAIETSFNKIRNDTLHIANNTRITSKEQEKIASILSDLQEARNSDFIKTDKSLKDFTKWAKLIYTKQGQFLTSQKQNLEDQLYILQNSDDYFGKSQVLINSEKALLELKRKVTDEALGATRQEVAALMLGVEIKKTQNALEKATLTQEISWLATSMAETADTFGAALTTVLTDQLMDRDPGTDWEIALQEGLARSGATVLSGIATSAIFGGKGKSFFGEDSAGLLHNMAKWFGASDPALNVIFPQTQVSILEATLKELRDQHSTLKAQSKPIAGTYVAANAGETAALGSSKDFKSDFINSKDFKSDFIKSTVPVLKETSLAVKAVAKKDVPFNPRDLSNGANQGGDAFVSRDILFQALKELQKTPAGLDATALLAYTKSNIGLTNKAITSFLKELPKSEGLSEGGQDFYVGVNKNIVEFVNAFRNYKGLGNSSGNAPDSLLKGSGILQSITESINKTTNLSDKVATLITGLVEVMPSFKVATLNLEKAFQKGRDTTDSEGTVVPGKDEFRVVVSGYDGAAMTKGMNALSSAIDGEAFKIKGFDGASLEQASTDLSSAFQGSAFLVNVQNFSEFDIGASIDKSMEGFFNKNNIDPLVGSELTGAALDGMESLSRKGSGWVHDIYSEEQLKSISAILSSNRPMTKEEYIAASSAVNRSYPGSPLGFGMGSFGGGRVNTNIHGSPSSKGLWIRNRDNKSALGDKKFDPIPVTKGKRLDAMMKGKARKDIINDLQEKIYRMETTNIIGSKAMQQRDWGRGKMLDKVNQGKTGTNVWNKEAGPFSWKGSGGLSKWLSGLGLTFGAGASNSETPLTNKEKASLELDKKFDAASSSVGINPIQYSVDQVGKKGVAAEVLEYLKQYYPGTEVDGDLVDHYSTSRALASSPWGPTLTGLGALGSDWKDKSKDDNTANIAGYTGFSVDQAMNAGVFKHTAADDMKEGLTAAKMKEIQDASDALNWQKRESLWQSSSIYEFFSNIFSDSTPDKELIDSVNSKMMNEGASVLITNTDELAEKTSEKVKNKTIPREVESKNLDLNIAGTAKSTAEEGVRQLITSGEVNTRNLAGSFASSLMTSATNKAVDAVMDYDWMSLFFANGGIAKGGFRAFASGGVVNKPTVGLVGEGKYNEAVVPLPDGKSIPVMGSTGSTENNVTVNVTVDSNGNAKSDTQSGMDGDQAKQLGYMVSQAVQAELVEQQRHGGLLSSY